ncbi:uncharacterized protein LOC120428516 isoform X1 [Culex pipiens pallens]|uniref:uncharacterized protein LOC120428516 isoform X1 n=1 Tax=Culex pipiens pallens TaxID=42434 RepID=UPI0019538546|nr:uncharacterized protein LOC120428516 isoform X1 [Culex pipiens pallens]XP_052565071.1 uncharacterized protein LOC120428516 isoform X1 [Culex pipiens pallens]
MANQVYKKDGTLGGARHGDSYQVHVLMLIFERAGQAENTFAEFRLATEMEAAGKFDDAVLNWRCGTESKWLLVQVKHKQKATKLTESSFFPVEDKEKAKGDFSVYKYLASMSDVTHNDGEFAGDKKFIIYTNCAIDNKIERWFTKAEMKDEFALLTNNKELFMNMNADENRVKNIVQFMNQDFIQLAKTIKTIFIDGITDYEVDIITKYRGALVQKVLLVEKKVARFTPRFIKRVKLTHNEMLLRQQLFAEDSTLAQLQSFSTSDEKVVKTLTGKTNSENSLPYFISDTEVFGYLKRLIFAVNQPDNEELKSTIQNDLKHFSPTKEDIACECYTELLYAKLQKMIFDRLSCTGLSARFLSNEDLCEELSTLQQTIEQSSSDWPTLKFNGVMQSLRVKFVKTMQLPNRYPLALNTTTEAGLLSSLKIFQTVENQNYRYASFKDIKIVSFCKKLRETLAKSCKEIFLLLKDDGTKIECIDELLKVVLNNTKVKLILLTNDDNRATQFFGNHEYTTLKDSDTRLDKLDLQSQQMLFAKNVLFQGVELSLGEIIQTRKELLKDTLLEKIIQDESIEIGEAPPEVAVKNYIPRIIRRCDSGDSTFKNSSDSDDDDSKMLPSYSEHEFIRKIPTFFQSYYVVVLSAEPGMGKTTLWNHLTPLIKQTYTASWVLHIKLLDCVNELRKVYRFENIEMVTEALIRIFQIKSNFEKALFSASLRYGERKKTIILLDGFDELPHDTITSVMSLFKCLQYYSYLLVNTRIHQKVVLESALDTATFTLEPIDRHQQMALLKSTCDVPSSNQELSSLVDQLFNKIPRKSLEAAENIIGIPLMVVMLAEIFKPLVQTFLKGRDFRVINSMSLDSLTLLDIYELFAYSSFRRQSIEKQNLDAENPLTERLLHKQNYLYKGFVKLHGYLGLVKLVKQQKMHLIFRDKKDILEFQEQAALLDSAIISKYEQDIPHFNHASFCEYFAAKCLFVRLTRMQRDQLKDFFVKPDGVRNAPKKQCIDDLYDLYHKVLRDYATVRKFFFMMAREDEECWKMLEDLLWSMRPYPLLWACEEGFAELVKRLLEEDPSIINFRTKQKETALHLSAAQGNDAICALLLNANVDKNAVGKNRLTALHVASSKGHFEVASILIARGASLTVGDRNLHTPLHLAAQAGHAKIVRLIAKQGFDVNILNKSRWSALHLAIFNGHFEVVKILLANNARLRVGKAQNWPMLLGNLITNNKSAIAQILVKHEARLLMDPENIIEILLWAIRRNHVKIVSSMKSAGDNLHFYDTQSKVCTVRLALRRQCFQIAEIIISNQSGTCEDVDYPLHAAAEAGSIQCAALLLKRNTAKVNTIDENGLTPLDLAVKKGHTSIVKMLLDAGSKINENLLHTAVRNNCDECVKLLLAYGADINYADSANQWTPLHIAAIRDSLECASELLKHEECRIVAKDSAGRTALHLAVTYKSLVIVREILKFAHHRSLDTLKELLSRKDNSGCTALEQADATGNFYTAYDIAEKVSFVEKCCLV